MKPEYLPINLIESKHYCEIIPFKRELSTYVKLQPLYPADTLQINQYNRPHLEPDPDMDEEAKEYGSEAFSWYKPFHFYDSKRGVYIRWRGVLYVAYSLYRAGYVDVDAELLTASLVKNAFRILHSHAYFHFLVEWAASFMEFLFRRPFYNPYVAFIQHGERRTEHNIEEALANAYALRQVDSGARKGLAELYRAQPSPYKDFDRYASEENFVLGKRKLGTLIHTPSLSDPSNLVGEIPWECIFNAEPRQICVWEVPMYWVAEAKPTSNLPQVVQLLMSSHSERIEALKQKLGQVLKTKSQAQGQVGC